MALTFVSHEVNTTQKQSSDGFDGDPLTEVSLTKNVKSIGTSALSVTRTAKATIYVNGSAAETAVTTVNIEVTPNLTLANPLSEEELATYATFLDDVVTAKDTVETGIDWPA